MTRQEATDYFVSRKENGERILSNKCQNAEDWAIKALQSYTEWISVEDRLPEQKINPITMDFQEIICFCDFGGEPKRTDVRVYKYGKPYGLKESHFWHGPQNMDSVVTHWMPLPEPPKEEL